MAGHAAYKDRNWSPQPAAESLYREFLSNTLPRVPQAKRFAQGLLDMTGVRIRDIVDHIEVNGSESAQCFQDAGWKPHPSGALVNQRGNFPAILETDQLRIWLRVESCEQFVRSNRLSADIQGARFGAFRRALVFPGNGASVGIIERNGYAGFEMPAESEAEIRSARTHYQAMRSRRREFGSVEQGLEFTEALVDEAVSALGQHRACDLWLKAEREFWMRRCRSGQLQKHRQDAAGIGWSNIDHHTYDSSRRHYRRTIRILERLGYELREMLYAGELAGWGSQVLEQPVIGSTIFADVDLAPEELTVDFAHEELPELPKHRRAGLLSALLGESILEAGLNHVAALYDQRTLRTQLEQAGLQMMAPFSDMPHLYQELTTGDWGPVDPKRVDQLERDGHIGAEEGEKLRLEGSIVTHLENIERNDGFKGFNREGIDSVLRKLDPRAYHRSHAAVDL